jgi:hypothetical protein
LGKNQSKETYAAVVGSSLDDLTEDRIGLTLRVGVLGLELAAVLNIVALLVVGETHIVLISDPGYQEEIAHEDEYDLEGRWNALYLQKSSARPTSAGTDPATVWRSPTAHPLFPQVVSPLAVVDTDG